MADKFNQSVTEGLTHLGMTQLGNIGSDFRSEGDNQAIRQSVKQSADATVAAMRERFYKKEYEQLSDLYVKPAMERMNKVQADFVTNTTPVPRTLSRPATQEELQEAANMAAKAAPGPQKDAKEAGPAEAGLGTASAAGLGAVKTWEAESYLDPSTGAPVDVNDYGAAEDVIRQYKMQAAQAYQGEFMGLMDQLAAYPNNPFASQAIGQMMKNLSDQTAFAATGREDRREAEEHMSQMQLNEAEYQEMIAGAESQELSNTGVKELRAAAPVLREAAYLSDILPELYGEEFNDAYFKNPSAKDIPTLRALNARARTTAQELQKVDRTYAAKQRELKQRIMPDTEPVTWPTQLRDTDEYKDAFNQAVGPVMGDLQNKWSSDPKFRLSLAREMGVGEHMAKLTDPTDDKVAALLTSYAVKEHPDKAFQAETAAFTQAYSLDAGFREQVEDEMGANRQRWVEMGQTGLAETFDEIMESPTRADYPNEKTDLAYTLIKMQDPTITPEQKKRIWRNSPLRKRAVAREAAEQAAINEAAADEAIERYGVVEEPGDFVEPGTAVEESISQPTDSLGGYASRSPVAPAPGKTVLQTPVSELIGSLLDSISLDSSISSYRQSQKEKAREKAKEDKKRRLEEQAYRSLGFGGVR